MNTLELREQIQKYVEQLSPEKLLVAVDFLAYFWICSRSSNVFIDYFGYLPNLIISDSDKI
ncbi:MAG: hypothetical protein ACKPFK_00100 [Dolichospermum sp.]